jgi:hypothetical protein
MQRAAPDRSVSFAELYPVAAARSLLQGNAPEPLLAQWSLASAETFAPQRA